MGLNVYSRGSLVGRLDMRAGESFYGFTYDPGYLDSGSAEQLSLSLPLQKARFSGDEAFPFFEGLLPEGDVRASIARQLGISPNSPAKLLRALGRDCAGDIAVLEEDDPYQPPADDRYLPLEGGLERLAGNPLAEIAELRADNRLSLAGGQEKIALYHDEREKLDTGWYVPVGGSPSTHIVKPQTQGRYPLLALNEFLCMRLAKRVGIQTADVGYLPFSMPLLVVSRYDRENTGRRTDRGLAIMKRVRQEDACQALGFPSSRKYQQEGGPGFRDLNSLLLAHSSSYLADRQRLSEAVVFNYLIGNCDAHAKNFSFLLGHRGTVRLVPLYDLVSTSVYADGFGSSLSRTMGMRIGEHANIDKVTRDDFRLLAEDLGMGDALLESLVADIAERLMGTKGWMLSLAAGEGTGADSAELVERLYAGIAERAAVCASGKA